MVGTANKIKSLEEFFEVVRETTNRSEGKVSLERLNLPDRAGDREIGCTVKWEFGNEITYKENRIGFESTDHAYLEVPKDIKQRLEDYDFRGRGIAIGEYNPANKSINFYLDEQLIEK